MTAYLSDVIPAHDRPRMDRTVLELRRAGLSHRTIAIVVEKYEGYEVTHGQVRGWLDGLGVPKNPRKDRSRRRLPAGAC